MPMPTDAAVDAFSWQKRKLSVVTARVTTELTGSHCSMRRKYSAVRRSCSAYPAAATPRQPRPRSAASHSVPGLVTVTHIGGCGFCTGFGRTFRSGIEKDVPSHDTCSSLHMWGSARTNSSHVFLVLSGSIWKPPSSVHVELRAVPNSSRPFEMMSSVAARSATRIGWFISGTHTTAPCPTRIRSVCAATAASTTSGEEQCEYSSRKWCSTAQTQSKPSSSASRACSSAWWNTPASPAAVNGRGVDISKKMPNFTCVILGARSARRPDRAVQSLHMDVIGDLVAETDRLDAILASLDDDDWGIESGAPGWTITDVVLHLAQSEEAVVATAARRGAGPASFAPPGGLDDLMDDRVRAERAAPDVVFERWRTARSAAVDSLRAADPGVPLQWAAAPLKPTTLATTRLAEHWAHGLDITEPLGIPFPDTERLRHVAWLGHGSPPYAFRLNGLEPQVVFCELTAPDGATWTYGPEDADSSIRGAAGAFCRVGALRLAPDASGLETTGPHGRAALAVLRNYAG